MTLFVVQAKGDDAGSLETASFIPDDFSRAAFVFGPLWLLYRGLWLPLVAWIILEGLFIFFVYPHIAGEASFAVDALAHLWLGFEGNRVRQSKAGRSAQLTDLVEAKDRDEAERIFYRRHVPAEAQA